MLDSVISRIHKGDSFWIAYSQYCSPSEDDIGKSTKLVTEILTSKKYTIKDTDASYRVINHWASLGLIADERPCEGKGWRKFSVVDLVWLKIISEIRNFGLSLDKIKIGYTSLRKIDRQLEYFIYICINRNPAYLLVFPDGCMELATRNDLTLSETHGQLSEKSYLVISLNSCMAEFYPDKNFMPKSNGAVHLSDKEKSILLKIRSGAYEAINIVMKNGEVDRIDTKVSHGGEIAKLSDILSKVSSGDFIIKKVKGKIVYIEETVKEKI